MAKDDGQFRERETQPNWKATLEYRHGLLMREVADLKDRIEYMEGTMRVAQNSMRPQKAQTFGISVVVAGVVAGIVQGIGQFFR